MKFAKRTHTCGELSSADIGKTVTLTDGLLRCATLAALFLLTCVTGTELHSLRLIPKTVHHTILRAG